MAKRYCYDYPRPAVAVDLAVVTRERLPRILLIRRKHEPFAGRWALPGGFVNMDESLEDAARRSTMAERGQATARTTFDRRFAAARQEGVWREALAAKS